MHKHPMKRKHFTHRTELSCHHFANIRCVGHFGKMTLPYSDPPCVPALVDELPEMLGASQGLVLAERHFRAEQEI